MKKQIQTSLEYLTNLCLEDAGNHREYTDKDLFNASWIFSTILLDVVYREDKHLLQEKMLELADTVGKSIRELIKVSTGKDMHEVNKKLI